MVVRLRLLGVVVTRRVLVDPVVAGGRRGGVSVSPDQPPVQHHHGDTRRLTDYYSQDAGVALRAGQWTLHVTERKF